MDNKVPKVTFHGVECDVYMSHYNGKWANNAIVLIDGTEPFCTASVNPWERLESNEVAIKDYSEQAGMAEVLRRAGIIGEMTRSIERGFVSIPVYELLIENPHVMGKDMVKVSE